MSDLADVVYEEGVIAIPDVPFYVIGKNTMFSGFGPAGDRTVYDVFPRETREQADAVARTARRPLIAMTNVRVVEVAPKPGPDRVLVIRAPARVRDWADMSLNRLVTDDDADPKDDGYVEVEGYTLGKEWRPVKLWINPDDFRRLRDDEKWPLERPKPSRRTSANTSS